MMLVILQHYKGKMICYIISTFPSIDNTLMFDEYGGIEYVNFHTIQWQNDIKYIYRFMIVIYLSQQ